MQVTGFTWQFRVNTVRSREIKTQVKDDTAVRSACDRLRLPQPVQGTHRLFSGVANGLGVQLPDWKYPVVCNLSSGELNYDNYNGRWGEQQRLDAFLQSYAVEKAKIEARRQGHGVTEVQFAEFHQQALNQQQAQQNSK